VTPNIAVEKRVIIKVSVTIIKGLIEVDNRVRVIVRIRVSNTNKSIEMELSIIGLPREVDNKVSIDTGIRRRADVEKRVKTKVSVTVFEPLIDVDSKVNIESRIREAEVDNRVKSKVSITIKGSWIDIESEVTIEDISVSIIDIKSLIDVDSIDTRERRE